MKRLVLAVTAFFLLCAPAIAGGGLDSFLGSLNVQARADLPGFSARISAQFGVPVPQVQAVIGTVAAPADAFMVFQLGQMAHQPPETVLRTYKADKGKGWGVIAKSLGIKPGSPEFHALKRGDFVLEGAPAAGPGKGQGKGKGKGKGHNK
jgi:hypothetical protein